MNDLVNRKFYLRDIVCMNTVDGVAHVLRGWDDDGEGQHAGGGQPDVDYHIIINTLIIIIIIPFATIREGYKVEITRRVCHIFGQIDLVCMRLPSGYYYVSLRWAPPLCKLLWRVLPVVKPEDEGVGVDLWEVEEPPEIREYFQHPEATLTVRSD